MAQPIPILIFHRITGNNLQMLAAAGGASVLTNQNEFTLGGFTGVTFSGGYSPPASYTLVHNSAFGDSVCSNHFRSAAGVDRAFWDTYWDVTLGFFTRVRVHNTNGVYFYARYNSCDLPADGTGLVLTNEIPSLATPFTPADGHQTFLTVGGYGGTATLSLSCP